MELSEDKKQFIIQECKKASKRVGRVLHHYTSNNNLKSIITGRELWAGDIYSMNDSLEGHHYIDSLKKALEQDLPEKYAQIEQFFVELHSYLAEKSPHIISLSRRGEDAGQWERYADKGKGVCISFYTEQLLCALYHRHLFCQQVFYTRQIRNSEYFRIIRNYITEEKLNDPIKGKHFNSKCDFFSNIAVTAFAYKHYSFCSEQEVRIMNMWDEKPDEIPNKFIYEETLRDFLRYPLDKDKQISGTKIEFENLFHSITIGPCSSINERELSRYLFNMGYRQLAKKVKKSQCPLRL